MDLNAIIENMETGDQDAALMALQTYNKKMTQCFTFTTDEEEQREDGKLQERLGELVLGFLERDLQPSCQLACLETIRILSRDKNNVAPFITHTAMQTLSRHAGIAISHGNVDCEGGVVLVPFAENPDLEIIVEALKSICNICLHNKVAVQVGQDLQLIVGIAERLKQCGEDQWNHYVRFFDLRLMFLLTAQRVAMRTQLLRELRGVSLLSNHLDATLGLCWPDTFEVGRAGVEVDPDSEEPAEMPPLSREKIERAMEILKILFNITYDANRREVDEEEAAAFRHLGAILRHCLMSSADAQDYTEEFHSHSLNLLGNLPLSCLDVLLMPKVQQGSIEYMGVNMDAVNMLLEYMEKRLDRGKKLKETMLPSLNLLTESARIHRETRKFLRMKVLPPLRDVKNLPEVGNALRNKLVRLMTNIDTDVKNCAAEFLFVLCKESVSRFIKYTGYGNAAGLLAARGLLRGGGNPGVYSEDEDSDTEEYREAKSQINPVTGRVEDEQPNPMEGMTEEQKELEAMKLVNMFDKLSRSNIIQPMMLGIDGSMTQMNSGDLRRMRDQIPQGQQLHLQTQLRLEPQQQEQQQEHKKEQQDQQQQQGSGSEDEGEVE
ncbi:chaperone Ric-8A isoform X1 [Oncorhynchus kisutch]|uniref:Synembryn n=1 Tax=Oncorhynchus kisutch TaxID=8019 RepID=A0A8C7FDD6_ONCKI|nr:synembryn-A isoform X1 [Oncorhynchus kisutch]